jgi:hypothetical protein
MTASTPPEPGDEIVDRVAWAVHAWTCPICFTNGMQAMADSGQDHVTSDDRNMASFLIGALGLVPADGTR